jgi:DNA polymerase-3 subunit chi
VTSIDFHHWPEETRRQHDVRVCELVEQAWQAGRGIYVHCLDEEMVASLDDLLWTFHDTSFVPHAIAGTPATAQVKILLGCAPQPPDLMDILFNLHVEVPTFFSQFERVVETTGHDPHTRQLARKRWRFYKDRGYPLATRQA